MIAVCATLAVLAAAANAAASVLQRKAARHTSHEGLGLHVLWQLARQPVWICGIAALLLGFVLQATALATGPITLVQPLLVAELVFTLVLSSVVFGSRLDVRAWGQVLGLAAGLALLLVGLSPVAGRPLAASRTSWIVGSATNVVLMALLAVAGRHWDGARRAALLGVAAGAGFGFTAALMSGVTAAARGGVLVVLGTWQTYAMIVMGPVGFFMLQSALRAGRLVASQPGLSLANPLVSIGWGIAVFGEQVRGGAFAAAQVAGAALVVVSTVLLARSPLLGGSPQSPGRDRESGVDRREADRPHG